MIKLALPKVEQDKHVTFTSVALISFLAVLDRMIFFLQAKRALNHVVHMYHFQMQVDKWDAHAFVCYEPSFVNTSSFLSVCTCLVCILGYIQAFNSIPNVRRKS